VGGVLAGWILRSRRRPAAMAGPTVPTVKGSPRAALHEELDDLGL
jgi:hypothetical protein